MDDDWDDDAPVVAPVYNANADGGKHFGKGRGNFSVETDDNDSSFDSGFVGGRGGGRGRGGRGGRGGGRGGFQKNFDNNYNEDNDGESNDFKPRGGGRGRGRGRGGGRGGGGGGGFRNGNDENGDQEDSGWQPRGGNRGDRGDRGDQEDSGWQPRGGNRDENKEPGEDKPPRVDYIPPDFSSEEMDIFKKISAGINFEKYNDIKVNVTGKNIPQPAETFEDAKLRGIVLKNIQLSEYRRPTPIQKHAWPIITEGRDLMACAQTGSGKTAGYLVPIINKLIEEDLTYDNSKCAPYALVLAPTRELVIQILTQCRKFSNGSIVKCELVYGGTDVQHQARKIAGGCHIIVATPGRLQDFVDHGRISFQNIRWVVLDEADRMLDLGFASNIEKIFDHSYMTPPDQRQVLMFSATFQYDIQCLAQKYLKDYIFVTVGIVGSACTDVKQYFYEVKRHEKKPKLKELLSNEQIDDQHLVLIFVEEKRNVDFTASFLSENGMMATSLHGDRLQKQREIALKSFSEGKTPILVATDVAARGLDIANITHVINFDLPKHIDIYIHRIGRTGRVGNIGKATSFFNPDNDEQLREALVQVVKGANQEVPDWLEVGSSGGSSAPGRSEFGGQDMRKFSNKASEPSAEPDEEW